MTKEMSEITSMDMANVMGSFISTELDAFENLYNELEEKDKEIERLNNIIKEVREKVENFDVFKEFTFPLMKKWEEQEVKSSIDYEWNQLIKKPILEILGEENIDG